MMNRLVAAAMALGLATGSAFAEEKPVKIGFISTFSGPTAVIGNDMRNSFELGLTISAASSAAFRSKSFMRTTSRSRMSACRRPRS